MPNLEDLRIKLFADGADLAAMKELARESYIKGLTTNPTLMRKAGVSDYAGFAKEVLAAIPDKPISFEVFSDDFEEMERQARLIALWGENVYVKIPIMNTKRELSYPLIVRLADSGVKLNVTAILTLDQVRGAATALASGTPAIVSVFAGRIADTGVDPVPLMRQAKEILPSEHELLWASSREPLNIIQAKEAGADIITVTPEILKKAGTMFGMDLSQLSLDTVKLFYDDGRAAGYEL
jgi:transaldolase